LKWDEVAEPGLEGDGADGTAGKARISEHAVVVNVALKLLLMDRYAQVGLAFATSIGAWVNFVLLIWLAARKDLLTVDDRLKLSVGKLALAGIALAVALFVGERLVANLFAGWPTLRSEATLAVLVVIGSVVYGGVVLALFGKQWLAALRRNRKDDSRLFRY